MRAGAAWRVKITPPESVETKAHAAKVLHHGNAIINRRQPKSAIMQANLMESKRGTSSAAEDAALSEKPRVRLTFWRRELLVGSFELDPQLRVRRADQLTGLIVGRPASSILKQPIGRFLNVPRKVSWEEMMGIKGGRKNALKTAPTLGKVSPIKAFEGSHPDGGSMRILLQGVVITEAMSGKTRIEVSIKPDMTFAAAHSDIWGALGLNCFGAEAETDNNSSDSSRSGSDNERSEGAPKAKHRVQMREAMEMVPAPPPPEEDDQLPPAKESTGAAGGDFVKRWVQTMDAQRPSTMVQPRASITEVDEGGKGAERDDWLKIAETMPEDAMAMPKQSSVKHRHGTLKKAAGGGDDAASEDDMSEAASSNNDEQRSAYSSKIEAAHEDEVRGHPLRGRLGERMLRCILLGSLCIRLGERVLVIAKLAYPPLLLPADAYHAPADTC